jgi:hypothetical protein
MIDYLKCNSKNFAEKHGYYEKIMTNHSIINSDYYSYKIKEYVQTFERILYDKLKLYFTQSYNDLFFNYPNPTDDEEEFDFEKDIIENVSSMNKYKNVHKFKEFIESSNRSENLKIQPIPPISPPNKKEVNDMEIDDLRTNISVKSYDQHSNQKKFAVIKNEICLRTSPPVDKIKSKIPFLREFNIKFTKRENIDKKLVRKFRKFLKSFLQKNSMNVSLLEDSDFWSAFINEELYPPMKFRCLDQNRVFEFKSFNTNYMAWIFSVKKADTFYREFIKEKGEEVFKSILNKNQRSINCFDEQEKNHICQQLRYYIINLANIFKVNKQEEENCESMPVSTPNDSGDIYDEMLELDLNAFYNEESHYNKKKNCMNRFE